MRVYEIGFAHPIGDFTGDLAKALSFPDAKNTTFKIEGVSFPFPKKNGTSNDFQISFTAQDFSHATYFCVNIFYNLDTGEFKMVDQAAAPIQATYASSEAITGPTLFKEDTDQNHCFDLQVMNNNTECFKEYWIKHQYQFFGFNKGRCPPQYTVENRKTNICGTNVVARNLGKALIQTETNLGGCTNPTSQICCSSSSDCSQPWCDNPSMCWNGPEPGYVCSNVTCNH